MWYTGKMKTPRVTEGPSQIKATASTPLYSFGNILLSMSTPPGQVGGICDLPG
jgi:hypothetical protein